MDRNLLGSFVGELLGLSLLGALGFVYGGTAALEPGKADGGWRLLEPVTYENLRIFPVVNADSTDTSWFLTLDEGLASGEVQVRELGTEGMVRNRDGGIRPAYSNGASVNQLVLINRSKRPLLLLAGELVSGGKQDRIIGKDRLVPAGSEPLPLDVFCVEHGRWSSGANFTDAKTIVHPSVREQAAVQQDQIRVWSAVRSGTTAEVSAGAPMGVGSGDGNAAAAPPPAPLAKARISRTIREDAPTESYNKIYKSRNVTGSVDTYVDELQRQFARQTARLKGEHVVGVVVAYGGEVAWSDIFASDDLFRQYWKKLLRSYVVEALTRPGYREVAAREDAGQFLRHLNGRIHEETEPGVYRWREINEGRLSQIELDALEPKVMTLHRLLIHRTN
jgi:ARG and Rhodanese-Phosphatase-superfamily-associated Protein domain